MIRAIFSRIKQGYKTNSFPDKVPSLPEKYQGMPEICKDTCLNNCSACIASCPFGCLSRVSGKLTMDIGKCIFCKKCAVVCPSKSIVFSKNYRMFTGARDDLIIDGQSDPVYKLNHEIKSLFGRSLKLRQVSAGGCNACEADINVLGTLAWDMGRFGIQLVASPRHADGLIVTGPVTENMKLALEKTYAAVSSPKIVIAVGACAISGGIYQNMKTTNGVNSILDVDLFIPGCPPHPLTILDGLLSLTGKIK